MDEYNVLLFGETGTGKTTFINACDIYLKYATLSEALNSKRIYLRLPFKFTWQDEEYTDRLTEFGFDVNENPNVEGKSVTRGLKVHTFGYQEKIFRLIDTPGFGDTSGCVADSENAKKIVEFLENKFRKLHAVCFILKDGENRSNLSFRYNIKRMLSLLHRDLLRNVFVVSTCSSGNDFKMGSVHGLFEKVFEDIGIATGSDSKRFLVDNKCFMYLLAVKLKIDSIDDEDVYDDCWNKTRKAYLQIFSHIQTLESQSVAKIKQVHDLRTTLEELCCRKLPQIKANINQHQTRLKEIDATIAKCTNSIERLTPSLYNKVNIKLHEGPPYYHLICKNRNCREKDVYGEDGKACCLHCIAWAKTWCFIFDSSNKCKLCGCSSDDHDYIYTKVFEEKERVKNEEIASILDRERDKITAENRNKSNVLKQIRMATREQDLIHCEIKDAIDLLKQRCFVTYSKECIEQIEMEMKGKQSIKELEMKGKQSIKELEMKRKQSIKELENYLKTYKQLYDICE